VLSKFRVYGEFLMDYLKFLMSFGGSEVADEL
jgi:hypothetical protein